MKAINKKAGTHIAGLLLAFGLVSASFTGCSNGISTEPKRMEYGSITIKNYDEGSASRSLDVSTITSANVIVSGYGMSDTNSVSVTLGAAAGTGSATINNIPVGNNRVVTVTSNVTGATIRAVCNITGGTEPTPVTVNWASTAVASVYYYLIKAGEDVSALAASSFAEKIPAVHASLFKAEEFAAALKTANYDASGLTADDYVSDFGTVKVTSSKASGYTLQITDIASEKKTIATDGETFTLKAYPGTWKAVAIKDGSVVEEKAITVAAGEESTVDLTYEEGGTFDGIQIQVAKSLNYPKIHYWSCSDKTKYPNTTWPGVDMVKTISDNDYIYNFDGCSSVSLLITNSSENKLHDGNMSITAKGSYRITSSGVSDSTYIGNTEPKLTLTVKNPGKSVKIYVSATSAPKIWVWQPDGKECTKKMGYSWESQPTMEDATDLNFNAGWYVLKIAEDYYTADKAFSVIVSGGSTKTTTKTTTFWYDAAGVCGTAGTFYDADPTTVPEPVPPTLKITPATGSEIGTASSIKIEANFGNDTPTEKTVTINGIEKTLKEGTNTYPVSDYATEAGQTIRVDATLTNSKGTATIVNATYTTKVTKEDPFCWENVNAYFVLTDRFANGDTSNDHSYYRKNGLSSYENVATFHGGDIKGLTDNLDYFDKLGVNAIWITAPYEQAHGWVSGKGHKFPHYAFHGYYTLDWTAMDQNMGTVEELRTFVNACHSKGIRVIMDIVMNHVGYNNTEDMITYNHGKTSITEHGWLAKTGCPSTEQGCSLNHENCYYANHTVQWDNEYWEPSWWGAWIRSWSYDDKQLYGGDCGGLPDVRHEVKESVGMAPVLTTKWGQDSAEIKAAYYNPSVANADWNGYSGDYRKDRSLDPGTYQVIWLSAWVREVGIDGFRCDTAKHVQKERWAQLKVACQEALDAWRTDASKSKDYNGKDTGAAEWDEAFWMTGEHFSWTRESGDKSYFTDGKFDSMIDFTFNGGNNWNGEYRTNYPGTSAWTTYLSVNDWGDGDGNGNKNGCLTYISSHDTGLTRVGDQYEVGTGLLLLPSGVQIYYGDESYREKAYDGCGDGDMMTRGDMNLTAAKTSDLVAHWGKVGRFRKYNPAVGAGTGTAYKRSYSGAAGENKVAIGIDGTSVDVSGLFADGTTVYNWYDGTIVTVSGGKANFTNGTGSMKKPILVSDRNPADYGVTF